MGDPQLKLRYVWRVAKVVDKVNEQLEYLGRHHQIKRVIPYKFGSGKDSVDGYVIIYMEKIEGGEQK